MTIQNPVEWTLDQLKLAAAVGTRICLAGRCGVGGRALAPHP